MSTTTTRPEISVQELEVNAFTIPTDAPKANGTLGWNATTIVVVHVYGGGQRGLGYTSADQATAKLIETMLAGIVEGQDAMAPPAVWAALRPTPSTGSQSNSQTRASGLNSNAGMPTRTPLDGFRAGLFRHRVRG